MVAVTANVQGLLSVQTLGIAAVRELAAMQTTRITNVPVLFTCSLKLFSPYCGNAFVGRSFSEYEII